MRLTSGFTLLLAARVVARRWALDLARLPAPRPLPNLQASLPLPARAPRRAALADGAVGRDPLLPQQRAPLQWHPTEEKSW